MIIFYLLRVGYKYSRQKVSTIIRDANIIWNAILDLKNSLPKILVKFSINYLYIINIWDLEIKASITYLAVQITWSVILKFRGSSGSSKG